MKALILAAGLGSRLKPLTDQVPKAMVKFKGIEVIKHQLDTLIAQGIDDITIITGYHSEVLIDFLNTNFKIKFNVMNNELYASSNSAYSSMRAFESYIDSDYIHINCDILFSESLLATLINDSRKNILCVRSDLELKNTMENVIGLEGRIVNMALRISKLARFKAFGLAKVSKEALHENLAYYDVLKDAKQMQENYFGLIRMCLGRIEYSYIESIKENLSELNTLEDLKSCKFILQ